MNEFKIGDKVRCVYSENRELIKDQIYTIFDIHTIAHNKYIVLEEIPRERYWPHRFKNVQFLPDELFEL